MATNDHDDRRTTMHTIADGTEPLDPATVTDQLHGELKAVPYPDIPGRDLSQEVLESLEESDDPLECRLLPKPPDFVTVGNWIRASLLELLDHSTELGEIHHALGGDSVGVLLHPSTLEHRTFLFDPTLLALAYRVGYQPTSLAINEEGDHRLRDIDEYPGSGLSFRSIGLEHGFDHFESTPPNQDDVSDDAAAVDALAEEILIDDTDWSRYLPWYQTRVVAEYQLTATATRIDWSVFPPRPTERPTVDAALEAGPDPAVGDFIRYAILHDIADRSGVRSIDTNPKPWDTDRVAVTFVPDASQNDVMFLPMEILTRLARYGYRPIAGQYLRPWWGHRSLDDPPVPRRIEFARGQALDRWIEAQLAESTVGDALDALPEVFSRDEQLAPLSWEEYLPCLRAQILTNLELQRLADEG